MVKEVGGDWRDGGDDGKCSLEVWDLDDVGMIVMLQNGIW